MATVPRAQRSPFLTLARKRQRGFLLCSQSSVVLHPLNLLAAAILLRAGWAE